uniref:Rhodanese domain-containing protein n=1 Tax=viral metagenome TaxID=1070528 RepID=A0A6C0BAD1_9ZZZZ
MGNQVSKKVSFQDIQHAQTNERTIIINTLSEQEQAILIYKTVPISNEISQVENAIKLKNNIIIYGKNSNDESIYIKYNQINKLGGLVYIYVGGLFEWLLLQDIYGSDMFKTTNKTLDILKFKPNNILNTNYITY